MLLPLQTVLQSQGKLWNDSHLVLAMNVAYQFLLFVARLDVRCHNDGHQKNKTGCAVELRHVCKGHSRGRNSPEEGPP